MLPPKRPQSQSLPAVLSEAESERPPLDSDRSELLLRELRGVEDRAKAATQRALTDLAEVYERELEKRDALIQEQADELDLFRRRSRVDDEERDMRIDRLARRLDEINRPKTEAAAASTTATLLNAARKTEFLQKAAYVIALVLLALWQLFNSRLHGAPTESIPVPVVRQADPSHPAGIP